jgi:hypothetical protein
MERWQYWVQISVVVCHCILLWRLLSQHLAKVYLFLTIFLAAEFIQGLALLPLRIHSTVYAWSYIGATFALWILSYFVVLELYRIILEDYPGISSVGRKAVTWCLGLAVVGSALFAIPDLRTSSGPFPILRIYYILERSTVLALLLFLVLIQVFLIRYRLRLAPNRITYAIGYAIYFGITVAQDVIFTSLGIRVVDAVGVWTNIAGAAVLLTGAVMLSKEGEARVQLEAVDSTGDRLRLQQQLTDINRLLSRAARGGQ